MLARWVDKSGPQASQYSLLLIVCLLSKYGRGLPWSALVQTALDPLRLWSVLRQIKRHDSTARDQRVRVNTTAIGAYVRLLWRHTTESSIVRSRHWRRGLRLGVINGPTRIRNRRIRLHGGGQLGHLRYFNIYRRSTAVRNKLRRKRRSRSYHCLRQLHGLDKECEPMDVTLSPQMNK